jgi:NAD(P)-dependent dehydrogenase (short-subunit alcohol dehydrogenase family)
MADSKKTVLITGSTRGIGLALAEHYTKAGWNIIGSSRANSNTDQVIHVRQDFELLCPNECCGTAHSTFALEDRVARHDG